MGTEVHSSILQRIESFKAMEHKDGKLYLVGIPFSLIPILTHALLNKILLEKSPKNWASILYQLGNFQGRLGINSINKKFGYAKTINDKVKLINFNLGQGEVTGLGSWKLIRADTKQKSFIFKGKSPIAEKYRNIFGIQREIIDYYMSGIFSGLLSETFGEPFASIENQCIATGKEFCELVVKPLKSLSKKEVKYYLKPDKLFKDLSKMVDYSKEV